MSSMNTNIMNEYLDHLYDVGYEGFLLDDDGYSMLYFGIEDIYE